MKVTQANGDLPVDSSRRSFLKVSLTAAGALCFGVNLGSPDASALDSPSSQEFAPNLWLRVTPDGRVTIIVSESEMGQGVMTSMAMLVAEELDVDWEAVEVEQAPTDPAYGWQGTGGSTSVRQAWEPLRKAGAAARELFLAAAALRWQVDANECETVNGTVVHGLTRRTFTYQELIPIASQFAVSDSPTLKPAARYRIVGHDVSSKGVQEKIDGSQIFGFDVAKPGMLVATIMQCPEFGGRLRKVNSDDALKVKGVVRTVVHDDWVAVVAKDTWSAIRARERLQVEWDRGPKHDLSAEGISHQLHAALAAEATIAEERGDLGGLPRRELEIVEAIYETPLQAHATMEPMCCTAHVRDSSAEIWAPTQQPTGARQTVAKVLGLDESAITVNTMQLGGGFGRRNKQDFVEQAVRISRAVEAPVKLLWTREEDIQHDFYHPATAHRLRAYLDDEGLPLGWEHRIGGVPYAAGAKDLPYTVPNLRVDTVAIDTGVPIGPWRSVAHHFNAFAIECFVNELAAVAGADPVQYRLALLKNAPRHARVLKMAADRAGWGSTLSRNRAMGVAVHASFGSYVAEVAEVVIDSDGRVRVPRVVCAVDCGRVIHPRTAEAQVEGSVAFALSAVLKGAISVKEGRVQQSNFHDFPVVGIADMPQVEVHFMPSGDLPGGLGEPAVPPLAPAVSSAVTRISGLPVRRIPIGS
jgi:isoquinoline 1-oxidoreductase beta subunit